MALAFWLGFSGCSETESEKIGRIGETPEGQILSEISVSEQQLRKDLVWLADDARDGRLTLTEGAVAASKYIAAEFEAAGLEKLPGQDQFRLPFLLNETGFEKAASTINVETVGETPGAPPVTGDFSIGVDFIPLGLSTDGSVESEVVFAGYGIVAPEFNYDDYADLDVNGKVVLIFRHTPPDTLGRTFSRSRYSFFRTKAEVARSHGAVGMLVVSDPRSTTRADDFTLTDDLVVPPVTPPGDLKAEDSFVAAHISTKVAGALVANRTTTLKKLQDALDLGTAPSKFELGQATAKISIKHRKPTVLFGHNVAGFIPGNDVEFQDEWVVVGAHYDHLGSRDSVQTSTSDVIYNGADDNASGTSGVLALARELSNRRQELKRSVVFLAFSGEEEGLLGSRSMLIPHDDPKHVWLNPAKVLFMLNLDMIGRNPDAPVDFFGDGYATDLKEVVNFSNQSKDIDIRFMGESYISASDHHGFFTNKIPVAFFFTGVHADYHRVGDHSEKIAYERMAKIVNIGGDLLLNIASGSVTPKLLVPSEKGDQLFKANNLINADVEAIRHDVLHCHGGTGNLRLE